MPEGNPGLVLAYGGGAIFLRDSCHKIPRYKNAIAFVDVYVYYPRMPYSEANRAGRKRAKARRVERWRKDGRCAHCGKEPYRTFRECERCLKAKACRRKRLVVERREAGTCTGCGRDRDDSRFITCAKCRSGVSGARNAQARARRAAGLCGCGELPTVGVRCEFCWLKHRARDVAGDTTKWQELKALLVDQQFRCAYSGTLLVLGENATVDHKIPRSRGGSNEIENLHWITRRVR